MANSKAISSTAIKRRTRWIAEIVKISGRFGADSQRIEEELGAEVVSDGGVALLDHLHLCGAIPEHYGHDSSEEKLYSKYTDVLLAKTLHYIGLKTCVLTERADSADVEAVAPDYSMVADAKVFRLSRTAKNQKDFKIGALHNWKHGKPYAMVVAPIYQLPARHSQIYAQAITSGVCIFTYSHLAVLLRFCDVSGKLAAVELLRNILQCTKTLIPAKDAGSYWACVNQKMLSFSTEIEKLWEIEKAANAEAIISARNEGLEILARERETIMRMTQDEAIAALLGDRNIINRENIIKSIGDNGILNLS